MLRANRAKPSAQKQGDPIDTVRGEAADAFLESIEFVGVVRNGIISSALNPTAAPTMALTVREEEPEVAIEVSPTAPSASVPNGKQVMMVPSDFIIYKCKIGGGKVIDIALPPTFRQVDVDKLHAFLKTQIDDEPAGHA